MLIKYVPPQVLIIYVCKYIYIYIIIIIIYYILHMCTVYAYYMHVIFNPVR